MGKQKNSNAGTGRYDTDEMTKRVVWIQAAGHCELCGTDLMYDYRAGKPMKWGEVAHILPASPKGPRAQADHDEAKAESLTNDPANLMLLCPGCHDKIDRDDDGYPESDLSGLHQAYLERVRLAATTPDGGRAIPVIVQSQHFATTNDIPVRDLLVAMSAEGLTAFDHPIKIIFPPPSHRGRDEHYWQSIQDNVQHELEQQLKRRGGAYGDAPTLAVVGLADIPALIMLGQVLGDRSKRLLFSFSREHHLRWPNQAAEPPEFLFTPPAEGAGPLALVLSVSAHVPIRDVKEALPGARIAELSIPEPSYAMVQNRRVIHAFRDALQKHLSRLEAMTADKIHVFAAIPAALAIEFGALLTTQHQHAYLIFDRSKDDQNRFKPTLQLGHQAQEVR
ncbi:SAVED domain-containing protein [Achromobacter mucicolens]|uniref:SAVED domain-containing protein n=1 Tax=Achromobacter mucicolens TaxID=1389922 RepID=A0ABD4Z2S6_9BURK|nr:MULTISPECIES: SAVED domain-containing protein [Achromobacter]MDH1181970.1 SAVED domain-containing protein [Achromobacter mucicolens]WLW62800.1 SAVED domain-containing protein [Achromobacter aegrifaciens]